MLPCLLQHQELEGKLAHPLAEDERVDEKMAKLFMVDLRVGDYRDQVEEGDEHCETNHPGKAIAFKLVYRHHHPFKCHHCQCYPVI